MRKKDPSSAIESSEMDLNTQTPNTFKLENLDEEWNQFKR